jgi:methylthioribose-1-phosphate isomerase
MKTIEWIDGKVALIDQTRLPLELVIQRTTDYRELIVAIKELRVRGAPAIGVAAAYAVAVGAMEIKAPTMDEFMAKLQAVCANVRAARPTAVNLFWAVERMWRVAQQAGDVAGAKVALLAEAQHMEAEDVEINRRMGAHGAELIPAKASILTHCNAGSLATVDFGTALGVIRAAHEQGKELHVFVDETRPLLQGARLTAWELTQLGIPATLITDNMAAHFMKAGKVDCVIVGADRIAANGDTANKIGTYGVAVLAKEHGIPMYVAAPTSTVDLSLNSGEEIPIEERDPEEVTTIRGMRIAAPGVGVANPAFDVTPQRYITAIITENGVVRPPFIEGLAAACR